MKLPFLNLLSKAGRAAGDGSRDVQVSHGGEREQFLTVLRSFEATRVDDRLAVLDIFLDMEEHVTLSELTAEVRKRAPGLLDQAFLQETMEMFCQYGFAQRRDFESSETCYEHLHLGKHHDHLICTKCGRIQEFHDEHLERLQNRIAQGFSFHPLQHRMEIYGLCDQCMATRRGVIPLPMAANGERVTIVEITGGRQMKRRLADMGLAEGACLEVVSNTTGPFVVIVNQTRLALGSGIAEKIMVNHSCVHDDGHANPEQ